MTLWLWHYFVTVITEENKRHAYIGWTDAPICEDAEIGVWQNRVFSRHLMRWMVTSDLKRCLQTARNFVSRSRIHMRCRNFVK